MSNHLPDQESSKKNDYSPEYIIAGWLEAITNFHQCYNQLIAYVGSRVAQPEWRRGNKLYIGQCPIGQLLVMVIKMRRELEKLAQDMAQGSRLKRVTARKNYKKLATHTLLLNRLNYQAQLRLDLSNLSAL